MWESLSPSYYYSTHNRTGRQHPQVGNIRYKLSSRASLWPTITVTPSQLAELFGWKFDFVWMKKLARKLATSSHTESIRVDDLLDSFGAKIFFRKIPLCSRLAVERKQNLLLQRRTFPPNTSTTQQSRPSTGGRSNPSLAAAWRQSFRAQWTFRALVVLLITFRVSINAIRDRGKSLGQLSWSSHFSGIQCGWIPCAEVCIGIRSLVRFCSSLRSGYIVAGTHYLSFVRAGRGRGVLFSVAILFFTCTMLSRLDCMLRLCLVVLNYGVPDRLSCLLLVFIWYWYATCDWYGWLFAGIRFVQ